jgi:hypothetical protein
MRKSTTRRDFLQTVAASATAAAVGSVGSCPVRAGDDAASPAAKTPNLLPTVSLGAHRVTRLILGGNPIYGHSHFNRLYSQHLIDYHTPERVVDLVRTCESAGINAWQNSYAPRTLEDVERCRKAGVRFHWLLLSKPDWDRHPELIEESARLGPIGIAPHGALAERLHRQGKLDVLKGLLARIRAAGVLVGLSSHNPALVELAEKEGWDVDYYMCCLYYLTRPREEFTRLLGEVPEGEVYLPSDRKRMLDVVLAARKPCLVYKVFAAGRLDLSPAGVRRTFEETFAAIKPSDALIVGMFQEFGDQVRANAEVVREVGRT